MDATTGRRLRIAEVAARSGFSTPTLRYYEDIGLMPAAERTDAGYRSYDDTALKRLRFISRAKSPVARSMRSRTSAPLGKPRIAHRSNTVSMISSARS